MLKRVYICSPLGGDVKKNLENAKRYTKYALLCGTAPVVTHFYALCLDDSNLAEREIGITAGLSHLWYCDELWIFGNTITKGMKTELKFCKNLNIKVRKIFDEQVDKLLGGNQNEK